MCPKARSVRRAATVGRAPAIAWTLLVAAALAGCASATLIASEPPGATVLIDGQPVDLTPVYYTDRATWDWSHHQVVLQKPGFAAQTAELRASDLDPGRFLLGVLLFPVCFPTLLFTTNYPAAHSYQLEPSDPVR